MDGAGAVMEAAEPAAAGCPRQAETSGMMELDSSPTAPIDAEAQLGPNLGHTSSGPPAVADRAQEEAHGRHDVDGGHPPSRREGTDAQKQSPRAERQHDFENEEPPELDDGLDGANAGPSAPGPLRAARGKEARGVPRNAVEAFAEYRLDQPAGSTAEPAEVKHFPVVNSVIALGWEVTQVRTWWDSEVRGSEGSEVRSEGSAFDFRFKVISGVPASH